VEQDFSHVLRLTIAFNRNNHPAMRYTLVGK